MSYSIIALKKLAEQEQMGEMYMHDTKPHEPCRVVIFEGFKRPSKDVEYNTAIGFSVDRALAFVSSAMDLRIGEVVSRSQRHDKHGPVFVRSHGGYEQAYRESKDFIIGKPDVEVFCGFRLEDDKNWQEIKMQKNSDFYWMKIPGLSPRDDGDCVYIFHFFRIEGYLVAEYDPEVLIADYVSADSSEYEKRRLWYKPGSHHHRLTVFDNPYGPYTNYIAHQL